MMNVEANMSMRNVDGNNVEFMDMINILKRIRSGKVYEFGCWDELRIPPIVEALVNDLTRVVSFSVAPKDDTLIYGQTLDPLRFIMAMENFHTEDFGLDIGRIISLRLWETWKKTNKWNTFNMVLVSYRDLGRDIFGESDFEDHITKAEAKRALEERQREEVKRMKRRHKQQIKKLQKEGERIAKMTDEEVVTKKVMADLEKDRLKEIQDKKDIAFASQFIEKEVKVQPTKTKKEKKRGNPYQKMLTLSREAGIKTINPDWVKWESENK